MGLGEIATAVKKSNRATSSLVADALREAILKGVLKGGLQLRQDALATELGVSRIPIREALKRLEAEGLVTIHPNRGAVVSELSGEEVQEIYQIRILLESAALRLAIPNMTQTTFIQTEGILNSMDSETDAVRWIDLNREFHSALYSPASRPRLLNLINTLRTNVDRYVIIYVSLLNNKGEAQREHSLILEASKRGNEEAAVRALEEHLERVAGGVATYLQTEVQRGLTLTLKRERIPAQSRDHG
jgi:DNA-binding GntR family transcriptional regulator